MKLTVPQKMMRELLAKLKDCEGGLRELRVTKGRLSWMAGILTRMRWAVSIFYGVVAAAEKDAKQGIEHERASKRPKNQRPKDGLVAVSRVELPRAWLAHLLAKSDQLVLRVGPLYPIFPDLAIVTDASPWGIGAILGRLDLEQNQIVPWAALEISLRKEDADWLGVEWGQASSQGARGVGHIAGSSLLEATAQANPTPDQVGLDGGPGDGIEAELSLTRHQLDWGRAGLDAGVAGRPMTCGTPLARAAQRGGGLALWVQQHREYRVWQKLKKQKKNKTRANKKKQTRKPKPRKTTRKKNKNLHFPQFFFFFFFLFFSCFFLFFWWFFLSICFFGDSVFDFVFVFFFCFFIFLLKSTFSVLHGVIRLALQGPWSSSRCPAQAAEDQDSPLWRGFQATLGVAPSWGVPSTLGARAQSGGSSLWATLTAARCFWRMMFSPP